MNNFTQIINEYSRNVANHVTFWTKSIYEKGKFHMPLELAQTGKNSISFTQDSFKTVPYCKIYIYWFLFTSINREYDLKVISLYIYTLQ